MRIVHCFMVRIYICGYKIKDKGRKRSRKNVFEEKSSRFLSLKRKWNKHDDENLSHSHDFVVHASWHISSSEFNQSFVSIKHFFAFAFNSFLEFINPESLRILSIFNYNNQTCESIPSDRCRFSNSLDHSNHFCIRKTDEFTKNISLSTRLAWHW